jgi:hypothetical protein
MKSKSRSWGEIGNFFLKQPRKTNLSSLEKNKAEQALQKPEIKEKVNHQLLIL